MNGLLVDVYRAKGCDCTNGGASSKHETFVLTGTNPTNGKTASGPFMPSKDCPELVLIPRTV